METITAKSTPPANGQVVPSIIRAGRILDALAAGPPTATLADLSRRLGIPRSSTLSICNSLVETGLLRRDAHGAYRLGSHTLELSRAYLGQTDLLSEFRRVVAETGSLREQTLVCAVRRGTDVVYVGSRPGTGPLVVSYDVGLRLPAHCTASGLAMLSLLTEGALESLYAGTEELEQLTPRSIASFSELCGCLAKVREVGYAIDDEETALGMTCLGAAVRDEGGETAGAVALSMPKSRRAGNEFARAGEEVSALAGRISQALGAPENPR
jgi:DNA-binding IclR family transcriptional regulator